MRIAVLTVSIKLHELLINELFSGRGIPSHINDVIVACNRTIEGKQLKNAPVSNRSTDTKGNAYQ